MWYFCLWQICKTTFKIQLNEFLLNEKHTIQLTILKKKTKITET